MNIGLDFDGTAAKDIKTFCKVADTLREAGHTVWVVTYRTWEEGLVGVDDWGIVDLELLHHVDGLACTGRIGKDAFMFNVCNVNVDVWIDDEPTTVISTIGNDVNKTIAMNRDDLDIYLKNREGFIKEVMDKLS